MVNRRQASSTSNAAASGAVRNGGAAERIAWALTVLWLGAMAVLYWAVSPSGEEAQTVDPLRNVMLVIAVVLPVAMIWVTVKVLSASKTMQQESARLQAAAETLRETALHQTRAQLAAPEQDVSKKLDEIAEAQRKTESALATFTTTRSALPPTRPSAPVHENQVALPLGTSAEDMQPPLEHEDFIRALNFPETTEDRDGFAALRRAMRDRSSAKLIQASQDVLTLLSQEGIYMDDLRPDLARPELWRRFAEGERGRQIAALGGVRDRSALALTAARMKQDPIFRDAAHHFLRKYDHMFATFAPEASDAEISALSNTRTGRAFMLLGRCAGTFD